jgi:hypothetical protein
MSPEKKDEASNTGFKVTDTRASVSKDSVKPEADKSEQHNTQEIPPIDFNTFMLSLSTSCLVHLGVIDAPDEHDHKNLPLAKQTIDLLSLLEEKTHGNLSGEEERLLSQILYDLRMRYIAATK